jgi:hypothetical protein
MKNEFIPYEEALAMKELGFDEPCLGCYDEKGVFGLTVMSIKKYYTNSKEDTWNCAAPLYQQAFRWFRENYRLDGKAEYFLNDWYCYMINDMKGEDEEIVVRALNSRKLFTEFPTYGEAELACLRKLIEIVNKNKDE